MANKEKESELGQNKKMSLTGKLFRLLVLVICSGIILIIYQILQPQNLSDIDGYQSYEDSSRNLQEVLNKAVEGDYSVTLTEAEINHMLRTDLLAKQRGAFSSDASIKRILVRLREDLAEVIIVREFFGRDLTISMYLQIQQTEDKDGITTKIHLHSGDIEKSSPLPNAGGRFGKFVIPQGFLRAVFSDYQKLAEALGPEIDLGFQKMARFDIQDKRVVLDPRRPTRHVGGEDSPF